jgi:glycosyltransferase involved in cell wall biosynthesis
MSGLRVLLVFRAPLGGLFRQVIDLTRGLIKDGHQVGIIADIIADNERAAQTFKALEPECALGVHRLPMHRHPHWSDLKNIRAIRRLARELKADVLHGHGSKGGLYARADAIFGRNGPVRVYTPHGGSFNYLPGTMAHRVYMAVETILERGTDVFAFESNFIAGRFRKEVGDTKRLVRVALNGLHPHEFVPRTVAPDATDIVFIGELRPVKGVDLLLKALAALSSQGRRLTATIIGSGPDADELKSLARALGVSEQVTFTGPMPAAIGLTRGRIMVAPSRFESLPYIVLETVAAQVPLITTNCGGIPEIVGNDYPWMLPVENLDRLIAAIAEAHDMAPAEIGQRTAALAARIEPLFNAERMAREVAEAYFDGLLARQG